MTQHHIKNIFFILITCMLFFLELLIFSLMQKHQIQPLLCFFILLLTQPLQKRVLALPLYLLCLLSYLDTNIFGWCLVYIMPTMACAQYLDQHLQAVNIIPYCLIFTAMSLKTFFCWYFNDITISFSSYLTIYGYNSALIIVLITLQTYLAKKYSQS